MSAFKTWLTGLTSKNTPVDADETYLLDSVTGNSYKLTWANLKATLRDYFDTAYLKLTGGTLAGGTVTASSPVLTTQQTWNNAGVKFIAKSNSVTSTASSATSLLEEWNRDGIMKFNIDKDGFHSRIEAAENAIWPLWRGGGWGTNARITLNNSGGNSFFVKVDDTETFTFTLYQNGLSAVSTLGIASSGSVGASVVWEREANDVVGQRRSTNAQTSRLYGTYTDASNYRRVQLSMTTAGVAELKPEGAGTGASGNVLHISGLPTSNPGPGILWNDAGTVKVGT